MFNGTQWFIYARLEQKSVIVLTIIMILFLNYFFENHTFFLFFESFVFTPTVSFHLPDQASPTESL